MTGMSVYYRRACQAFLIVYDQPKRMFLAKKKRILNFLAIFADSIPLLKFIDLMLFNSFSIMKTKEFQFMPRLYILMYGLD